MPRLNQVHESFARGRTGKLFNNIIRATGRVLNMFRGLGNSPAALRAYLQMAESLKTGVLSSRDRLIIGLVVSDELGSRYCMTTHKALAKMQGMDSLAITALLDGKSEDHQAAAFARFVRAIIRTAGNISDDRLATIRDFGYGDDHIAEIVGMISLHTYANYFNALNRTECDSEPNTGRPVRVLQVVQYTCCR